MSGSQDSTSYVTLWLRIARWTIGSRVGSVIGRIAFVILPGADLWSHAVIMPYRGPHNRWFALHPETSTHRWPPGICKPTTILPGQSSARAPGPRRHPLVVRLAKTGDVRPVRLNSASLIVLGDSMFSPLPPASACLGRKPGQGPTSERAWRLAHPMDCVRRHTGLDLVV